MIIHLNEDKFYRVFLTEATAQEVYQKYYTDIPYNTFCQIIQLDPTSNGDRMGKYSKWLLNIYRRGTFKEGDFNEAIQLLPIYDKYKNVVQVKDIMTLNSMAELYRVVEPYMEGDKATSKSDAVRRIKSGAEKVYEDNQWLIIIPHTKEAAIQYGKNTEWCTAAEESENMFDYYNNKDPLYINIDKVNNRKYQFHFETSSFMDEEDESILYEDEEDHMLPNINTSIADMIEMPSGARGFYEKLYSQGNKDAIVLICSPIEFLQKLISDRINTSRFNMDIVDNAPAKPGEIGSINILGWTTFVRYRSSYVIDSQVIDKWFRECSEFVKLDKPIVGKNGMCDKIASVIINDEDSMFIDEHGNFVFDKVFYSLAGIASNGYAVADYRPEGYNKYMINIFDLNNNCTPVFDIPFDTMHCYGFNGEVRAELIMSAERIRNGNRIQFYINARGFEFNYTKWYQQYIKTHDYEITTFINKMNDIINDRKKSKVVDITKTVASKINKMVEIARGEIPSSGLDGKTETDLFTQVSYRLKYALYDYMKDYIPGLEKHFPSVETFF